jgi:non-specific serine/threonine protein kinase
LTHYEAVSLFLERARLSQPDFTVTRQNAAAVARICSRLDGIPLALELAAARMKALSVETLHARLDDMFRLLTGGSRTALPRQQTLRALIDWSYDLLSEPEKVMLQRLSVFAGGWTLEAAEEVCAEPVGRRQAAVGNQEATTAQRPTAEAARLPTADCRLPSDVLDLLTSLVEKSLAVFEGGSGPARYRLLEPMRQYGRTKLVESDEGEQTRDRHLACFLRLVEEAEPNLGGAAEAEWLKRLETEHDNLRAALEWSISANPEGGLRILGAVWRFWEAHGYFSEGRGWLERLHSVGATASGTVRAKALHGVGTLALLQGDYAAARRLLEESQALSRNLGDPPGIAASLSNLGTVASRQGDHEAARGLLEESLRIQREIGDRRGITATLYALGGNAVYQGDFDGARVFQVECLRIQREFGDRRGIAASLNGLAVLALWQRDLDAASSLLEESLSIRREVGDRRGIAMSLNNLGMLAWLRGDLAEACRPLKESLAIRWEIGDKLGIAECLEGLAIATWAQSRGRDAGRPGSPATRGQVERGARLFGAAEALREVIGALAPPNEREEVAAELSAARAALGEEAFAAAWREGRALPLEEIVALALEEDVHG